MDAPNRSPSPNPIGTPLDSSSSSSPVRTGSPTGSPVRKSAQVTIKKVKLNDASIPPSPGLNASKVKEVKDTIIQKTDKSLFDLYEIWNTHKIVDAKLNKLLKENKKDPEIPALKQKLESTNKDLKKLNEINDISADLLLIDMSRFMVNADNRKNVEEFCRSLLVRMKAENAKALISLINEREVALATEYRTVNRDSMNMAQFFITAFQEGNLSKIIKLDVKYSDKPEEAAKKIVKKLIKAFKENKNNDLLSHLYSDLHSKVERKFPGKGDELVLSLILLRYLGPNLTTPPEGKEITPAANIQISKILQSYISKETPKGMNLSKEFMEEGYDSLRQVLPNIISRP